MLIKQAEKDKQARMPITVLEDPIEDFGSTKEEKGLFGLLDERLRQKLDFFRALYRRMLEKREKPYSTFTGVCYPFF